MPASRFGPIKLRDHTSWLIAHENWAARATRLHCRERRSGEMISPTAENSVGGGLKKSSSTKPSDVQQLVMKARLAQAAFESYSQEQVDAIVRDFGKYVYD